MKFGVVVFPGSNCDKDLQHVIQDVLNQEVEMLWHKDQSLTGFTKEDCICVPGGFSYGDYLRPGAIARQSPIMKAVVEFANKGGYVWGICNGFQILCEAGLLPGVLLRNDQQLFRCHNQHIKVCSTNSAITRNTQNDEVLNIPIAHADGRFVADDHMLKEMTEKDQILFKYCNANGEITIESNPNGSIDNIAGICNENRNVFGMMPHPERCAETILGNDDGVKLFHSLLSYELVG